MEIKWNNIDEDAISNFDTVDPLKFSNFGTPYDRMVFLFKSFA